MLAGAVYEHTEIKGKTVFKGTVSIELPDMCFVGFKVLHYQPIVLPVQTVLRHFTDGQLA